VHFVLTPFSWFQLAICLWINTPIPKSAWRRWGVQLEVLTGAVEMPDSDEIAGSLARCQKAGPGRGPRR
jgi:hypothetical protein